MCCVSKKVKASHQKLLVFSLCQILMTNQSEANEVLWKNSKPIFFVAINPQALSFLSMFDSFGC